MSKGYCRECRFWKQLPARIRMGSPDPLSRLDEAIAALKVVDCTCNPPTYMIGDLQLVGAVMGFRANSRGYLRHMAAKAVQSNGNVLECGSGLSTLLLAVTAARQGHEVHTFEHDPGCHQRLLRLIDRYQLTNVTVHHAPIRSYGNFDWYDLPRVFDAGAFQLVICDGPYRHLTDSGRYGLFPVMQERLDSNCRVIMDDSNRDIDRRVIGRWRKENRIEVQSFGRFLQFAEIVCV